MLASVASAEDDEALVHLKNQITDLSMFVLARAAKPLVTDRRRGRDNDRI